MIRTKHSVLAILFAFVTITMLAGSGCKPTEKPVDEPEIANTEEATSVDVASKDVASNDAAAASEKNEPNANDESLLISGDLASVDWPSLLGKQITVSGNLVVVDTFDLARRGQVTVARDRLYIPTGRIDPNDADPNANSFEGGSNVAKVVKAQKQNDNGSFMIDDGSEDQNIFPPALFPNLGKSEPTVRIGSVINGVSGKLEKAGNKLVLRSNEPLQWTPAKRPSRPSVGEGNVTVSSFNVLNYFTTIDNGKNSARGADTDSELNRQEAKLVAAIVALEADVIGLMEIENNLDAEYRLVAALNKEIGKEAFKGCGLPDGFRSAPGGADAIRVGIIYRADRVDPVGEVSMIADDAFNNARTPVVQKFKSKTADNSGSPFAVIVNHFKSKGGASRADVANKNKGDGQGAYNATRRAQSLAICKYVDEQRQNDAKSRILVIGDLNAYGQEDPIDAMRARGLVDLREHFEKANPAGGGQERDYSYVFRGQSGSMDHAMATDSLAVDVTGVATWHINADEPRFLDYNEEYNPKPLYQANPFRSSDHDPVLIGIRN